MNIFFASKNQVKNIIDYNLSLKNVYGIDGNLYAEKGVVVAKNNGNIRYISRDNADGKTFTDDGKISLVNKCKNCSYGNYLLLTDYVYKTLIGHSESQNLKFVYDRMISYYNENPNYDYMLAFKSTIDKLKNR